MVVINCSVCNKVACVFRDYFMINGSSRVVSPLCDVQFVCAFSPNMPCNIPKFIQKVKSKKSTIQRKLRTNFSELCASNVLMNKKHDRQ